MNPFSKRIHQIKNPDLDLPKGTRNPFLDLKSVFGFTERNTPLVCYPFLGCISYRRVWVAESVIHSHLERLVDTVHVVLKGL